MKASRTVLAATSILLSLGAAALGQQPGSRQGGAPVRGGVPTRLTPGEGPTLTVDFPGGTLEQFIKALRDSTKEPVNISLQGEAGKLRIDPLMLREVTVEAALRAALGTRANGNSVEPDGRLVGTQLEAIDQGAEGRSVLVVTSRSMEKMIRSADSTVDVLSIRSLVSTSDKGGPPAVPEQVVLSAIDTGLKLNHAEGETLPEINYHKDSGLLLIRGLASDVRLVQEIVRKMKEDQERRTVDARERRRAEIGRNAAMQRAQITADLAERKMAAARTQASEIEQMVKAGNASSKELTGVQLAVAQAQAEAQMAHIEMDRLKQEADAGLDGGPGGGEARPEAVPEVEQLRAQLGKALQRIKELEDQVGQQKSGKPNRKGE